MMVVPRVTFVELHCISTTAIKFENNYHFITDMITVYLHFVFSTTHLM